MERRLDPGRQAKGRTGYYFVRYRLSSSARATVTITKGKKVVKRYKAVNRAGGKTYRLTLPARRRARGDYRIRLQATGSRARVNTVLVARRL